MDSRSAAAHRPAGTKQMFLPFYRFDVIMFTGLVSTVPAFTFWAEYQAKFKKRIKVKSHLLAFKPDRSLVLLIQFRFSSRSCTGSFSFRKDSEKCKRSHSKMRTFRNRRHFPLEHDYPACTEDQNMTRLNFSLHVKNQ